MCRMHCEGDTKECRTHYVKLVTLHLQVRDSQEERTERLSALLATRGMPNARVPLPMEYSLRAEVVPVGLAVWPNA